MSSGNPKRITRGESIAHGARAAGGAALLGVFGEMVLSAEKSPPRPNVLFVFADRMRAASPGCMGNPEICLTFMRGWHAGTMRRALFGPVSPDCPGSLVQEHPNVEVILTELAAQPPVVNIALDTGEEDS